MAWDRVHTITEWYDWPLQGVADLGGRPHVYDRIFSESEDDFSDTYYLMPITQDVLKLALESWKLWRRWQAAFNSKVTTIDTHPVLPEDRQLEGAIRLKLGNSLKNDPKKSFVMKARFRLAEPDPPVFEVEWSALPGS